MQVRLVKISLCILLLFVFIYYVFSAYYFYRTVGVQLEDNYFYRNGRVCFGISHKRTCHELIDLSHQNFQRVKCDFVKVNSRGITSYYAKDHQFVYHKSKKIPEAHAPSFKMFGKSCVFAQDKHSIYLNGARLNIKPEDFQELVLKYDLNYLYADKSQSRRVFLNHLLIQMGKYYWLDAFYANGLFVTFVTDDEEKYDRRITNDDINHPFYYRQANRRLFYLGSFLANINHRTRFDMPSWWYPIYILDDKLFYTNTVINDHFGQIDFVQFFSLNSYYYSDKQKVFTYFDFQTIDADAKSFDVYYYETDDGSGRDKLAPQWYEAFAKDKFGVFFKGKRISEIDMNSFELLDNSYARDHKRVYYFRHGNLHYVAGADPRLFRVELKGSGHAWNGDQKVRFGKIDLSQN